MRKKLCACGCGDRVTGTVEQQHMNVSNPAVLASQVLDQNRRTIRWKKKKTKVIGYPAPLRRRLTMRHATEIADMDVDDYDPDSRDFFESVMGEDLDEAYGRSGRMAPHVEHSKSLQNISDISLVDQDFYVDHAGPSGLTHDDFSLPDPLHDYRPPSLPPMTMLSWEKILTVKSMACPTYVGLVGLQKVLKR
jgi:hypothetical protein